MTPQGTTIACAYPVPIAMRTRALPFALLVFLSAGASAQEISVKVERHGESVVVDVEAHVPDALREAWAVFTDYDNMASYISSLTASKVLERKDHVLHVMQSGQSKVGFLTFGFEAVRAVELVPMREIRTQIRHHGEYVPKKWLPPLIGPAVIERETRKQYQEFAAEIERRTAAARR